MRDTFGTEGLRRSVLDAWTASAARFREDANAEQDLALGGYRDRLVVELAQNAADAAARAGADGRLRLVLADGTLTAANTGQPLDAAGVESLSTLRASAKRDGADEGAVGRFGVGFSAVLAVSDEPAVVTRAAAAPDAAEGVRWSLAEARELTRQAAAAEPGLAAELDRREGHVPLLRLPLPAPYDASVVPAGYDTAVLLPLRDEAAESLARRLLAAVDDALLLALPGLAEVVIETGDGPVRTLTRHQEGPYVRIEDSAAGATRWRLAGDSGLAGPELLADRPVEERARPGWTVTWAVPVDAEGAPRKPRTAACLHAPTPTDEPLGFPALLLASFPLEPTRRHVAPGPLTLSFCWPAPPTPTPRCCATGGRWPPAPWTWCPGRWARASWTVSCARCCCAGAAAGGPVPGERRLPRRRRGPRGGAGGGSRPGRAVCAASPRRRDRRGRGRGDGRGAGRTVPRTAARRARTPHRAAGAGGPARPAGRGRGPAHRCRAESRTGGGGSTARSRVSTPERLTGLPVPLADGRTAVVGRGMCCCRSRTAPCPPSGWPGSG